MEKNDLVYICSPVSAPSKEEIQVNMGKATIYASAVAKYFACRTIAPHSFLPLYLDDNIPEERKAAIEFGLSIIKICKLLVVCGFSISSGMESEIEMAKNLNIPICFLFELDKKFIITK